MGNVETIYHYCDLEAFHSIISTSIFWLSDVRKSNDFQECVLCRDRAKEIIEMFLQTCGQEDALNAWHAGYKINLDLEAMGALTYSACFSEAPDLLSQWRGYADDGYGMAIGVSKKHLDTVNGLFPYNLHFDKVLYEKETQNEFIASIAKENIDKMSQKSIWHVALELNSDYLLKFPFCKNPSFQEEKEWRTIFLARPGNKHAKTPICGLIFSEAKYRTNQKRLISYLEMDFSSIKQDFIKEIWIGPKSSVKRNEIRDMLFSYGYYDNVLTSGGYGVDGPIAIHHSSSSYQ